MATPKKPLTPLDKKLDKVPTGRLYAALGRRSHKKLKAQAPELLVEREKKRVATKAIRAKYCTHTFLQPKVRSKGPHIGLLVCPSCNEPFDQAHVMWIEKARCCDPKHVGCTYEGRCWLLQEPEKAPRCMQCPDCGGFEFKVQAKVDRSEWTHILTGRTA